MVGAVEQTQSKGMAHVHKRLPVFLPKRTVTSGCWRAARRRIWTSLLCARWTADTGLMRARCAADEGVRWSVTA